MRALFRSSSHGDNDLTRYRAGYPGKKDDPDANRNILFYQNKLSGPEGLTIDQLDAQRGEDYRWLEACHEFIQWLFPIQERGLNWEAQVLMQHEILVMRRDSGIQQRVWRSFETMLRFYGMSVRLHPDAVAAGAIPAFHQSSKATVMPWRTATAAENPQQVLYVFSRSDDATWQQKLYTNLNRSSHNYLRITRILKFLGEMGMEDVKLSWLVFLGEEVERNGALKNCSGSLRDYWSGTIYDDDDREQYLSWLSNLARRAKEEGADRRRRRDDD